MDRSSRDRKVMALLYLGLLAAVFLYIKAEMSLNRVIAAMEEDISVKYEERYTEIRRGEGRWNGYLLH